VGASVQQIDHGGQGRIGGRQVDDLIAVDDADVISCACIERRELDFKSPFIVVAPAVMWDGPPQLAAEREPGPGDTAALAPEAASGLAPTVRSMPER
jgi:hypothetical protein